MNRFNTLQLEYQGIGEKVTGKKPFKVAKGEKEATRRDNLLFNKKKQNPEDNNLFKALKNSNWSKKYPSNGKGNRGFIDK